MAIDIGTLSFLVGFIDLLQVFAFLLQYLITRAYRGIGWWAMGSGLVAVGFALFLMRQAYPQQPAFVLSANTLITLGLLFVYIGVTRFFGRRENRPLSIAVTAAYVLFFLLFTLARDSLAARTVAVSLVIAVISFMISHTLLFRSTASVRASATFNAVVAAVHGCFFLFRAAAVLVVPPSVDFFTPTILQTALFLMSLSYSTLQTLGFIIMVNQRLAVDSREAKEHFEILFNTSPDAVLISSIPDGRIVHINDGFARLTGYTREELVGRSMPAMDFWGDPEMRGEFMREVGMAGLCENMEASFRRKDGSMFMGMISAKRFILQGEPHVISVTRDITRRKKAEEALAEEKRRLQKTLDEVSTLRGILPICAHCKKIRDDKGYWNQVEQYVADHSEVEFSHGICPDCMRKLYPGLLPEKAEG